jgi:glycerol-3-phosphate dehydrogenase subunit B
MTQTMLADCGLTLKGEADTPHMRVTPLGTFRQAWLSPMKFLSSRQKISPLGWSVFVDFSIFSRNWLPHH